MTTAVAQGKINLVFQVGPLGQDGYHEVASIYQGLEISETVTVTPSQSWKVICTGDVPGLEFVPTGEENIVVKAAKQLAKFVGIENPAPMEFVIQKQIPVAGGMAGGSADAAAALVALNEAWCLDLDEAAMSLVGAKVGADVPFALLGGTALGTGSGTELSRLPEHPELHVLLVFSGKGLSTKDVFSRFDELSPLGEPLSENLASDYKGLIGQNSLQAAALSLRPDLARTMELNLGISGGYLSGSGPTIWFCTESKSQADAALELAQSFGYSAVLTKTSNLGARLI
jgi:4-diphosphocytidyl-2C-methyl-D-erythritol kinase